MRYPYKRGYGPQGELVPNQKLFLIGICLVVAVPAWADPGSIGAYDLNSTKGVAQTKAATHVAAQCDGTPSLQLQVKVTRARKQSSTQYVVWNSHRHSASLKSEKSPSFKKMGAIGTGGIMAGARRIKEESDVQVDAEEISSRAPTGCIQALVELVLAQKFESGNTTAEAAHERRNPLHKHEPVGSASHSNEGSSAGRPNP